FFPDNLDYGLRLAAAQVSAGRGKDALATIAALRRLPPPLGDDPRVDFGEAEAYFALGDFGPAGRAAAAARARAEALGAAPPALRARITLAWSLISSGEMARGIEILEATKQGADAARDGLLAGDAADALAAAYFYTDDPAAAAARFADVERAFRAMGNMT